MTERAEPPMTFGGTARIGGVFAPTTGRWRRPAARAPTPPRPTRCGPRAGSPHALGVLRSPVGHRLIPRARRARRRARLARRGPRARVGRIGTPVSRARRRPRPRRRPLRRRLGLGLGLGLGRRASGLPPRLRDVRGARGRSSAATPWASPAACSAAASPNPTPRPSARLRARLPTRSPSRPGPAADSTRAATSSSRTLAARTPSSSASLGSPSPTRPATRRPDPRFARSARAGPDPRRRAQPVLQIELATLRTARDGSGAKTTPRRRCARRAIATARRCARWAAARGNPPREVGTRRGAGTPRSPRDEHGHPRERSCGRSRPSTRATPPRTSRSIHTACPRCWWRPRTARCVAWTPPAVLARAGRAPRGSAPATGTGTGGRGARTRRTRAWLYRRRRKRFVWLIFARGDEARGTSSRRADATRRPWRAMAGPRRPRGPRRRRLVGRRSRVSATPRASRRRRRRHARERRPRARVRVRVRVGVRRDGRTPRSSTTRDAGGDVATRHRRRARVVARGPDGGVAGNAPPRDRDGGRRG